jgi:hypothetical protein
MNLRDEVNSEFYFYLNDGRVLKSASELMHSLNSMSNDVFVHHVNAERNDFSNWIRDIYGNKELALSIKKCKTKDSVRKCMERIIKKELGTELKKNKEKEKELKRLQKKAEKDRKNLEKLHAKKKKEWERELKDRLRNFRSGTDNSSGKVKKITPPSTRRGILNFLGGF